MKKQILHLGWDGAYVLSRRPIRKELDHGGGNYFLNSKGRLIDIQPGECASAVFGAFKLGMFEVVKLEVTVVKAKKRRAA